MGVVDEEAAHDGAVRGSCSELGSGTADFGDSQGGFGGGAAASGICGAAGVKQGRGFPGSKQGLEGRECQQDASGVRESNCGTAGTSGIHREAVGRGRVRERTEKMKTLVTAIQKGGQGKTFATCHLAFDFHERGLSVAVIDLDTQGNASYTLDAYKSEITASQLFTGDVAALDAYFSRAGHQGMVVISSDPALADLDKVDLGRAAGALRDSIEVIGRYFDVCLIDTAPSLGVGMTAAVLAADYMLSPIEMERYSLQGMQKMVAVIGNLRKINPKMRFVGMVPNKVDARRPRHKANLAALQAAYPQLVLPFSIGARDSIAEALEDQIPVWKVKKTAARMATKEVRQLADYVYDKMEITQ